MWEKIVRWWYFKVNNPIVRKGEHGGFKWCFRRYWLDIETVSGNFSARFMAAEHPYAYLLCGEDEGNIEGFCQMVYSIGMLLTTDQGLVDDVRKAFQKYAKRKEKSQPEPDVDRDAEDIVSIEQVKQVQEYIEKPKSERRKEDRKTDRNFRRTVKEAAKDES